MLPVCPQLSTVSSGAAYRYMDYAIREIVRQFDGLGARRTDIQIKLFGGADVLLDSRTPSAKATVGKLNVETALEVLAKERLQVVASSVGGNHGRKIYFNSGTGEVLLRRLAATTIKETQ
jgi:chemotaxis protein CheD